MRGYTHLSVLRHSNLPYMVIYVVIHHASGYKYIFTLQAWLYTVLRTLTLALHQMWLYAWLRYTTRGYTLNAWLYTFICILRHFTLL